MAEAINQLNQLAAITITPLARQPWRVFWVVASLIGLAVVSLLITLLHSATPTSNSRELLPLTFPLLFIGLLYLTIAPLAVADYDSDFLYLFKKTGTKQIPLGSFYKLKAEGRGYWQLHYHDEQEQPKKLRILPVTILPFMSGLLRPEDNTSIHGFIEAIWRHNPQLDVNHY